MEYDEQDNEVVSLLLRLKETENKYPVDMLAARRQRFVKQAATLGFGAGAAFALGEAAKGAGGSSVSLIAGTILETALIVAIVAEAGYVAIINRDKILDLFQTNSTQPAVEHVGTPPDSALSPIELPITGPTLLTETAEPTMITETPTLVGTPSSTVLPVTATSGIGDSGDEVHPNSTPEPHDDNGNHYGQTPRPERTKDSGSGGGNSQPTRDATNTK